MRTLGEKVKIAALAVEDEHVLMSTAYGYAYSEEDDSGLQTLCFRYEEIENRSVIPRARNKYGTLRDGGDFTSSILVPIATDFLDSFGDDRPAVLGISTFGTIDTQRAFVQHVPSRGPRSKTIVKVDLKNDLRSQGVRIVADNDATSAAFGEYLFGAGRAHQSESPHAFVYVWAGRGLNAGIVIDGSPWQGRLHPEMGHLVARLHEIDQLPGGYPQNCGIHKGGCLTGLAGFRTLQERVNDHGRSEAEATDAMAYYLAQLCAAVTLTVAPIRIVLGGLSMRQAYSGSLLERVCAHYAGMVAGFPGYDDERTARNVLIPAQLGDRAGMLGILEIARRSILPTHQLRTGSPSHAQNQTLRRNGGRPHVS